MISTELTLDDLTLSIIQELQIEASLEATFAALLDQLGPYNETSDGKPLHMKIEAWPGGRWYRDLGDGNGHFWAHVQAIKRPTLLEFAGPLFASSPFASNVQYRLTASGEGTLISFRHSALGYLTEEQKMGAKKGWNFILEQVRKRAETR